MNIFNPTEEMILAEGWVEYVEPTKKETIEDVRMRKIIDLEDYDKSENVNIFYIGDTSMWLDKATRTGLMLRFNAEMGVGKTETTLWYNGEEYLLDLGNAVQMLYAIEVYASQCYDNTQKHLKNIRSLTTMKKLKSYDITTGYPDPLVFNN